MRRRDLPGQILLAALAARATQAAVPTEAASLAPLLQPMLARFGLPALAAAAVQDGRIIAAGAVGVRRWGTDTPVTLVDRFHIGSDTKAMTALLVAMLVEEGRLRWDTSMAEAFRDLATDMEPRMRGVTLVQLLSHTSGFPSDNEVFTRLLLDSYAQPGNLDAQRAWMVRQWSTQPLASAPGSQFAYSNMGYITTGAMAERATGSTWEELVAARVFGPLGLSSAGFGPAASMGRVDATLGHELRDDGTPEPRLAGPNGDNPVVLGPAGTVHLSIGDFATWAGWHAGEGRRGPALVRPETLRRLHAPVIQFPTRPDAPPGTPSGGAYGLGWGMLSHPWSSMPFLQHAGSNTLNLALILVQPSRDFAMVMVTNIGGRRADEALRAVAEALYRQHGPARS